MRPGNPGCIIIFFFFFNFIFLNERKCNINLVTCSCCSQTGRRRSSYRIMQMSLCKWAALKSEHEPVVVNGFMREFRICLQRQRATLSHIRFSFCYDESIGPMSRPGWTRLEQPSVEIRRWMMDVFFFFFELCRSSSGRSKAERPSSRPSVRSARRGTLGWPATWRRDTTASFCASSSGPFTWKHSPPNPR